MNHQPFEDWLLNDKPITQEQKRELDMHMRTCAYCAALAETGIALKSVKKAYPQSGFANRFQARLVERKMAEQRRRLWGSALFTVGGLVLLMWLSSPYLFSFLSAPAAWIAALIQWGVFILTTMEAVAQAGSVFVKILPDFLSPFAWMVLLSAFAGVSLLWTVSIWRFVRVPRGV
ncbi:MAG TPA: hypothetical protein VK909_22380 [Anaerolineales bacterium]|nr:hypothetical protein [Anaerolineales bacterium]